MLTVPQTNPETRPEHGATDGFTLVIGAGGFRGRAAIGVLAALEEAGRRPDAILGVSAGAVIGACWAILGWTADRMASEVASLTSGQLLAFAGARALPRLAGYLNPRSGVIPSWLEGLDRFDWGSPLQNGVRRFGVTTFDLATRRICLFATGIDNAGVTLAEAVRGSAAVPPVFRPVRFEHRGRRYALVDGGLADTLPIATALAPPFSAKWVLAVSFARDPRVRARAAKARGALEERGGALVVIRPTGALGGTILASRRAGRALIESGRRAVTPEVLHRLGVS